MHYLLKNKLYHKPERGLFKIWINSTNRWLTPASKKRGSFSNRCLTRDLGGNRAAIPRQWLELQLLIPAPAPSSSKSLLEGNGSQEVLIVVVPKEVDHCLVLTCSRKSYQNEFVLVPSFRKGLSCLFGLTPGIHIW